MSKAVFVTGAASGTGYTIVSLFASRGYDVFITSRRKADAEKGAAEISKAYGVFAKGFECNIGDERQVKDIFADIDSAGITVETLVLNAANLGFDPENPAAGQDFWTVSVDEFRNVFETNLVWNFTIVRQAALRMKNAGKGAIVFISSNTAYRAIPNRAAYSASKGGINAFTKALAVDLGKYGIRCNVVLPGTIKTERWRSMGGDQKISGALAPTGDISDFADIANAVWFLGTDESRNITGAELNVDGGMSCQLYPQILNDLLKKENK